jgi:hypothetical protein
MVRKHNGIRLYSWSTCAYCAVSGRKCRYIKTKQFLFTIFKTMDTIKRCDLRHVLLLFQHKALFACAYHSLPGADPVVLLTDALNLALVGGSGGILPREILKSRTSGNAISCVLRELFFEVHTSKSKRNLLDFRGENVKNRPYRVRTT